MDLKQIETFRAVMATGATTSAAAVLRLSQSAVSRQLAQLEAELGFDLFARSKGRLIARPEAHALLREVDPLSELVGRIGRFAAEVRAGSVGHALLRVAVPHSLSTTLLPGIIRRFLADRSGVSVEVLPGPYGEVERLVATHAADLGFVRFPPEEPGFAQRPLLVSGSVCVMPRAHPLAALPTVTPPDLAPHDLVLLGRDSSVRQQIDLVLRRRRAAPPGRVEAHSVASACAMVAEGLGVTVVTRFMALLFGSAAVEIRPFAPSLSSTYGIISDARMPLSIVAEHFVQQMSATLARHMDA